MPAGHPVCGDHRPVLFRHQPKQRPSRRLYPPEQPRYDDGPVPGKRATPGLAVWNAMSQNAFSIPRF